MDSVEVLLFALVLPWLLFFPLYLFSILHSSLRDWNKLEDWRDVAGWAALLIFQLGLAGGTGILLYFAVGIGAQGNGF